MNLGTDLISLVFGRNETGFGFGSAIDGVQLHLVGVEVFPLGGVVHVTGELPARQLFHECDFLVCQFMLSGRK